MKFMKYDAPTFRADDITFGATKLVKGMRAVFGFGSAKKVVAGEVRFIAFVIKDDVRGLYAGR